MFRNNMYNMYIGTYKRAHEFMASMKMLANYYVVP